MFSPTITFTLCLTAFTLSTLQAEELTQQPLQPPSPAGDSLFKIQSPDDTGIRFINPINADHPLNRLYISGFACGGVSLGDLDRDGLLDVVLTSGPEQNKIFRQTSHWKFEEIPWDQGNTPLWSSGASIIDIDGDGDLDIYVCHYDHPNHLYLNETKPGGTISFREAAKDWGLDISDASLFPAFADYDLDGDLDLFLLTSEFKRAHGRPKELPINGQDTPNPTLKPGFEKYYTLEKLADGKFVYFNAGRENILLQNQLSSGKKHFTDVSKAAGIHSRTFGLSCTWYDHDADGDPDLYVCNDFDNPDQLYLNNGDGTFTDVIKLAVPYTSWYSMGSDTADLNGDGRFDLVIADMGMTTHYKSKTTMGDMNIHKEFLDTAIPRQAMRNTAMINTGTGRFQEAAYMAGLASTDWTWAVKCSDFDCDGLVDVFFSNGMSRKTNDSDSPMPLSHMFGNTEFDFYRNGETREEENLAFRNLGDLKFQNISKSWGLNHSSMSYSAATGDIDNDGDPDLIVANLNEPVTFYENTSPASFHRVAIQLRGLKHNHYGIGAIVHLTSAGNTQVRQLNPMTGFLSCNESSILFGLGDSSTIDSLVIEWPGGTIQRFSNLTANQLYTISQPTLPSETKQLTPPHPLFAKVSMLPGSGHRELSYDDYAKQPLLPWKHSKLGPGMAWADLDNDGDHDFFLAQGKGSAGYIYYQQPDKSFKVTTLGPFAPQADSEDMAPLFFDADNDGRLDLLITSGSVEADPGNPQYSDRIYLGIDQKEGFSPAYFLPGTPISSSVAAAADVDRDGDLDLFIGGRIEPGKWPLSPTSRLYINHSTPGSLNFTLSPNPLPNSDRATSALWTDIDNDGWIDLLVTREYGTINLYHNQNGTLIDITQSSPLANRTGVWNGIAGRDIDHDGDIDYIVSNFGINTTYKASIEKPELLYYGDLDGSGSFQVVEAKFEDGIELPRRGLSCSSHAMPSLTDKLKTYKNFAASNLQEIYTPKRLEDNPRIEVTTLESSILINQSTPGKPSFQLLPLPRMAQLAPAFGVIMTDLDGDQHTDAVLAQNFYSPQREVGRMSGSVGAVMLKGTGDPQLPFTITEPFTSGLITMGDSKALTVNELNGDNSPDLIFSENSGPVSTFLNTIPAKFLQVQLIGKPGNLHATGASVTITTPDGKTQTAETYTGGGYLSQSSNTLFFGLGQHLQANTVTVRWPDGNSSQVENISHGLLKLSW